MQDESEDNEKFHTLNRQNAERAMKQVVLLFAVIMLITLYEFLFDK